MRFIVTALVGLFLMILEGVVLAVFQVEAYALQMPLALAIFAARDRSFNEACWLMSVWLLPAYLLVLIPDFRWMIALVTVFGLCALSTRTFNSENRLLQFVGNIVLVIIFQGMIAMFSFLLADYPEIGVAALSTMVASALFTAVSVFWIRALFHYIDKTFFEQPKWSSFD